MREKVIWGKWEVRDQLGVSFGFCGGVIICAGRCGGAGDFIFFLLRLRQGGVCG